MVQTPGKVRHFVSTRFYFKPALGKMVIRKSGVDRRSARVIARNEAFKTAMEGAGGCPATSGGVPWHEFISNLKRCAAEKGLGRGESKTREYRMKFNKYLKTPKIAAPA